MAVRWRRLAALVATIVALVVAGGAVATTLAPSLAPYDAYWMTDGAAEGAPTGPRLAVTFLGVATLLLDDGETALMTDGFFSRPGLLRVATRIAPDSSRIMTALERAGVTRLAAVIPVHTHYDHAMDAPWVARWTGAKLVGSASTASVGRGGGLSESQIIVAVPGDTMTFGRFHVRLLHAEHVPSPFLMPGEVTLPLTPPARTRDYRLGECYSVVIEHDGRTIVVQGSAGFAAGALRDVRADVVYLGVATLGKQPAPYRDSLWNEVVVGTGARRVIAIHWDDFLRPLSAPLRPMPRLMDDFDATMRFLTSHGGPEAPDIRLPVAFRATDPFVNLPQ